MAAIRKTYTKKLLKPKADDATAIIAYTGIVMAKLETIRSSLERSENIDRAT